jgi:hypothetical protein
MRHFLTIFLMIFLLGGSALAQDEMARDENPLAIFAPLIGTWTGEGTGFETPTTDVMQVEWILGGHAVQHSHSLNNGEYGGTTIYFWDGAANDGEGAIIYHYFTTAGFHTQGTMTVDGTRFEATEAVEGHPTITEVRSISEPDGEGAGLQDPSISTTGRGFRGTAFTTARRPTQRLCFLATNRSRCIARRWR